MRIKLAPTSAIALSFGLAFAPMAANARSGDSNCPPPPPPPSSSSANSGSNSNSNANAAAQAAANAAAIAKQQQQQAQQQQQQQQQENDQKTNVNDAQDTQQATTVRTGSNTLEGGNTNGTVTGTNTDASNNTVGGGTASASGNGSGQSTAINISNPVAASEAAPIFTTQINPGSLDECTAYVGKAHPGLSISTIVAGGSINGGGNVVAGPSQPCVDETSHTVVAAAALSSNTTDCIQKDVAEFVGLGMKETDIPPEMMAQFATNCTPAPVYVPTPVVQAPPPPPARPHHHYVAAHCIVVKVGTNGQQTTTLDNGKTYKLVPVAGSPAP